MDLMTCLFIFPFLCLSLYLFMEQLIHKLLNLPPTPFPTVPIIGHLYLLKKPLYKTLFELSCSHGPIIFLRFGSRRVLLVSSRAAADECLTKNDVIFANRPRLLSGKYFGNNYTNLVWASYTPDWRNLRRISSVELLSSSRLQALAGIRSEEVRSTVRNLFLLNVDCPDKTVNLRKVLFELTFNIMMRMIAGKRYYGETAVESSEARRFREMVEETRSGSGLNNMGDYLPFLRWLPWLGFTEVEKKMADIEEKRERFMQELIEEERDVMHAAYSGEANKRKNMIQILLSLHHSQPQCYTDEMIRNLMLVIFSLKLLSK